MRWRAGLLYLAIAFVSCQKSAAPGDYPPAFTVPSPRMPASGYGVAWGPATVPAHANRASKIRVRVFFRNTGDATWTAAVHLLVFWVPVGAPAAGARDAARRIFLRRAISPGQTVEMDGLNIDTPKEAGKYQIVFDLVNEEVAYFTDKGASNLALPVTIE